MPTGHDNSGAARSTSPWWVRLVVYTVLVVIALLAIRVIDAHVMATQRAQQTGATPLP